MGLQPEDPYTAELRTVLRTARALRDAAEGFHPPGHSPITSNPHSMISSINLPCPHPLLPSLLEAGFSRQIAASVSEAYQLRAEELRRRIQESIATTCREIAELPVVPLASSSDVLVTKLVATFTELYLRRLEQWKEDIIQRIKQTPKMPTKAASRNFRTFNQEYVPLFECFFAENPFPTHADKMFLAKKSNMEYRQIHVWFQNRRNRIKKEGKPLRKNPIYEGGKNSHDKLYERMEGHVFGSDSQASKASRGDSSVGATKTEISRNDVPNDTLVASSPLHAFPTTYPPACHYDPFPCRSGPAYLGVPEWRRTSCGRLPSPFPISVDELVERFSQLNVRDETRSKGSSKLQSCAATAAITIIPSCAPHPSLIDCNYRQPGHVVKRYPIVRAPVSSSNVFKSPNPTSEPATLVPLSISPNKGELPGMRKTAPLPRRFPGRMRNTPRDTTPSESSITSSTSPHLFSMDPESRSCSFSNISSLSTPSDITSTQELPHLSGPPCRSQFDSPIYSCDLRDVVALISPSVS